ncbi:MAG: hypothetical protein IPH80_19630 [Myxococcales bacterium]|nr:hypothetical protein [Myxococcales bacterium]
MPLGVRIAFRRVVDDFPSVQSADDRQAILRAARRNLAEDAVATSLGRVCQRAVEFILDAAESPDVPNLAQLSIGQQLASELADAAQVPGHEAAFEYLAELRRHLGYLQLGRVVLPLVIHVAEMTAAACASHSWSKPLVRGWLSDLRDTDVSAIEDVLARQICAAAAGRFSAQGQATRSASVALDRVFYRSEEANLRGLVVRVADCATTFAWDVQERSRGAFEKVQIIGNGDVWMHPALLRDEYSACAVLYESVALLERDALIRGAGSSFLSSAPLRFVLIDDDGPIEETILRGFEPLLLDSPDTRRVSSYSVEDEDAEEATQRLRGLA